MNRWRKSIICLLLVTIPMSLWAAVAAPQDCDLTQPSEQIQSEYDAHAHHDMGSPPTTGAMQDNSPAVPANPDASCDCCESCLAACLVSGLSVLHLQTLALESPVPEGHFSKTHASQIFPGPSYPSLYRPPISQS